MKYDKLGIFGCFFYLKKDATVVAVERCRKKLCADCEFRKEKTFLENSQTDIRMGCDLYLKNEES